MTSDDDTTTAGNDFGDGCYGQHSPATNGNCEMGPGPRRSARVRLASVSGGDGARAAKVTEDQAPPAFERDFDPAAVALEATERGEDPLSAVVGQYGGYLSACWDDLAGAGVFESERAAAAADAVTAWLRDRAAPVRDVHVHHQDAMPPVVTMEPGDRLLLVATREVSSEVAATVRDRVRETFRDQSRTVTVMDGFAAIVLKAGVTL